MILIRKLGLKSINFRPILYIIENTSLKAAKKHPLLIKRKLLNYIYRKNIYDQYDNDIITEKALAKHSLYLAMGGRIMLTKNINMESGIRTSERINGNFYLV